MSKILKIKETAVLDVIKKIINEQATSEITITASNDLGTHPDFSGLKQLLIELKTNVQNALRGATPYRIKTSADVGTTRPSKKGNELTLSVTLVPSEEAKRHWFFEGSAAIYSYVNTTSFTSVASKVRMKAMEKARASFAGSQPQELYPNHITLKNFTGLNSVEPTKEYKIMLAYLTGSRPEGFYDVGDEQKPTTDVAPEVKKQEAPTPEVKKQEAPAPAPVATPEQKPKQQINEVVNGNYTAKNCDELHAFQSTGGKVIGNMNVTVGQALEELYKKGINPKVTSVKVNVDGMNVDWTCTIQESTDGKAWVGFTSRGAGCNNNVKERAESVAAGNDMGTAKQKIETTYGEENIDIQKLTVVNYNGGKNSFSQVFYVYTKPQKFPAK